MTNNTINSPIGVFDSGIGGLTVVKELIRNLPGEDIIYLGDTARVPYGTKSGRTVMAYSHSNSEFLISKGVKLLVVACNTASSVSIPSLRAEFDIPVIGVIEPGAKKAVSVTKTGKIGVIGTPSTINSGAYKRAIESLNPNIEVISKACPLFVPLADEGWVEGEIIESIAEKYLSTIIESEIDVLVLGCTHYPLLKNTIQKIVGGEITLVDSAEETSSQIQSILIENNLLNDGNTKPIREFYLTDVSDTFISVAGRFLGEKINKIEMVDIIGTTRLPSP
ncbi:MAG: glutamate racemase [Thermodesulfobacteriota bacterium]